MPEVPAVPDVLLGEVDELLPELMPEPDEEEPELMPELVVPHAANTSAAAVATGIVHFNITFSLKINR